MEWLEMKIDTSHAGLDPVCAMLEQQGVTGWMIDDETDFQDFLEHNRQYWDYVDEALLAEKRGVSRVTFYLERNENALSTIAAVRIAMSAMKKAHPEYAPLRLTMDNVADADWENNWKQFYKPMEIGDRLLVVPEWEQASDPERITLRLNPGLTFGTGSHATTRLCLQALDAHIHGGEKVLDLGWARPAPSPATSTRSAWMWPTKTPPSTVSPATPTPFAGAMCSTTSSSAPKWAAATTWWWPTSWPTSSWVSAAASGTF